MLTLFAAIALGAQRPDFTKDLDTLLTDLKTYGAYVLDDKVDFAMLDKAYRPRLAAATSRDECLPIFESLVGELHDFHASLGVNNQASPRLVPSGTDLFAIWRGNRAFIDQVRMRSLAKEKGVQPGDEVLEVGGEPVRVASAKWFGVRTPGPRGWDWALNSALAGRWNIPRRLRLKRSDRVWEVTLPTARTTSHDKPLSIERLSNGIIVLRPEDSLGENDLLKAVDAAVPEMRKARGIVIDLRNTASGGNTTVARGIMGLFISHRLPYQRHVVEERDTHTVRDWVEYATPRLRQPLQNKLAILVDRWTGSMGEGIACGFDAMHRGTVVGTEMAGLRGAVDSDTLPVSGIRVFFPTERLFHVSGTPRHEWLPPVRVIPGDGDPWMAAALRILR